MMSDEKNIDLSALDSLSEEERKAALEILKQYADTGQSELFEEIKYADYEEIPVDIHTFLHDKQYLGRGLYDAEGRFTLFPYWEERLHDIFPDNLTTKYNNIVLTGCLAYDTEIPLLNGKVEKIGDLAKNKTLDEYVYSYDVETNSYAPGHLVDAFSTGVKPIYEIELDNGTVIKATSNHKFMTRDKHWKSIDTGLAIGDSMMPFNRTTKAIANRSGYEVIENPNKDGTSTEVFTHRLVMEYKRGKYSGVVHHKDFNKRNNDPRNLLLTDWITHKMYHAKRGGDHFKEFNERRKAKQIPQEVEQAILDGGLKGCINRWSNQEEHLKMSKLTTARMNAGFAKQMSNVVWTGKNAEINKQKVKANITTANKNNVNNYQISKAIKISNLALLTYGELTEQTYEQTKLDKNMRCGYPSFKSILARISYEDLLVQAKSYNHKIVRITYIGEEEVFDLTVEKYHNFAINNGIIAHNSIGIGKTLVADIILLYMLYRLLCLKNPYTFYGMQEIDKISISFMNITLDAAKGVALDKLNQLILSSEWFMAHGEMAGTAHLVFRPQKHIELIAASSNNQIVGRAIFANFTDEANFSLFSNPEKQKTKMMKIITQVDARMKSRYMRTKSDGSTYLPTINIIASSKDTEQSFLEEYIDNKKRNDSKTTLIVDEPQWVVDERKDSPIKFWVAIGDKMKSNELLPVDASEELVTEFRDKGYQMWQVPIGYLDTFQLNLDEAICSIIGIATASSLKYISGAKLLETKTDTYRNPFIKDVIEVGNAIDDYTQYSNYFDLSMVSEEDKARPLFIHLDMSTGSGGKGDKTGIAGVWITGRANNTKSPPELTYGNAAAALATINNDGSHTMDMAYKLAFSVSIKAPKGASISFSKNRNFIRWLREQGFAIKGVSMDTFQSSNIFQDLQADGFKTEIVSVDRVQKDANNYPVCMPYHYFKTAIYERRLMIYQKCDLLTDEIIGLERKSDGHIDHTKEGINCLTGDTKISLVDGRELTMLELLNEFNAGKINYVYTINENTLKIEPKPIINAFKSGTANTLIKVTLDNGETIQCTPEHKFMLRNGIYCEAKNLLVNDSLMPLYRKYPDELISMHDYRMYYEPIEDKWHYEHRQFANEVLDEKYLVHHKNCIKTDNTPTNLVWCSRALHQKIHSDLETGAQSTTAKEKRRNSLKKWHAENKNNIEYILSHNHTLTIEEIDEYFDKKQAEIDRIAKLNDYFNINYSALSGKEKIYYSQLYYNIMAGHNIGRCKVAEEKHAKIVKEIEKTFNVKYSSLSDNEKQSYAIKLARQNDPTYQERVSKAISKNHALGKYDNAHAAIQQHNNDCKKLRELFPIIDKQKFIELFEFDYDSLNASGKGVWSNRYRKKMYELYNHTIVKIEYINCQEDVYDLTIQDNPNFATTAGVFVHNSKDQCDAVCGATWLASKWSGEYSYNYGDNLAATLSANDGYTNDAYNKQQLIVDFEEELKKISLRNYQGDVDENSEEYKKRKSEAEEIADWEDGIIII